MNEIQLKQTIIKKLETMGSERLAFLNNFIDGLNTDAQAKRTDAASTADGAFSSDDQRRAFVSSLRGKYAHVATISDEFARRKQQEIDWENRHR